VIEVAAEGTEDSFHAGGVPVGEVGEGALGDLTLLASGLAEEDGGRGVVVRDGLDLHGNVVGQYYVRSKRQTLSTWVYYWICSHTLSASSIRTYIRSDYSAEGEDP
jgi:hypothetical protein